MARDDDDRDDRDEQLERYRQAAEDALQQLDWCIGYLHGIRKLDISKALAKNRSQIRRHPLAPAVTVRTAGSRAADRRDLAPSRGDRTDGSPDGGIPRAAEAQRTRRR